MIIAIIMKEINGRFTVRPCQRSQSMIITILLAGLLLILAAGIRCGFALDDLIWMAVNGIKKAVNVLSVLAIVGDSDVAGRWYNRLYRIIRSGVI